MNIVVRTRSFQTFLPFFKTFNIFHREYIKDLIVQIQSDNSNLIDIDLFKILLDKEKVKFVIVENPKDENKNYWAEMLYKSLQYKEVISLDDDIIFTNLGLFDKIKEIAEKTKKDLLAFSYYSDKADKKILSSYFIYKGRGIKIKEKDFLSLEEVKKYNGVDTALLVEKYNYEFLDTYIKHKKRVKGDENFIITPYFIHVGGMSWRFNEVYNHTLEAGELNG